MNSDHGFTLAESFMTITAIIVVSFLLYGQWQYTEASQRDSARKIAINTIHYYLKESYFRQNQAYPSSLNQDILSAINQELTKDPRGRTINSQLSDLRYIPGDCTVNACQRYELRADLEKEDDFVRTNR